MGTYCCECGEKLRYDEDNWDTETCGRCLGTDQVKEITKERDTLKEALRLACENTDCPEPCPLTHKAGTRDAGGELEECSEDVANCWQNHFIQQVKGRKE